MTSPRVFDVATGTTSTLRVALIEGGEEGPTLVLAHGFGRGQEFHRPGHCTQPLVLPPSALGDLRAALDGLEGGR